MPRFTSGTSIQHRRCWHWNPHWNLHWNPIWAAAVLCLAGAALAQPVELPVPDGVLPPEIPEANPPTQAKVELGKKLYFDTRLSTDGTVACATCHDPRHGFADGRGAPTSAGVGGAMGTRNAPTVLNAAFLLTQFWDGRAATLEEQAVAPLANPIEHGFADHDAVLARMRELDDYPPLFEAAFGGGGISIERVGQAIASFERTLLSLDAPIERFLAGDSSAISESAQRGWELFNAKARCNNCHGHIGALPLFTDDAFHNIGVGVQKLDFDAVARRAAAAVEAGESVDALALSDAEASELGRFLVTREPKDLGAFKTPQLRNIALTAPYMHDGSEKTLRDVIEFYDRGGNTNPYLDGGMRPLNLTDQEKADLVALLETFTSEDLGRFADLAKLMP
jgi:cytochrome c peroxidase